MEANSSFHTDIAAVSAHRQKPGDVKAAKPSMLLVREHHTLKVKPIRRGAQDSPIASVKVEPFDEAYVATGGTFPHDLPELTLGDTRTEDSTQCKENGEAG